MIMLMEYSIAQGYGCWTVVTMVTTLYSLRELLEINNTQVQNDNIYNRPVDCCRTLVLSLHALSVRYPTPHPYEMYVRISSLKYANLQERRLYRLHSRLGP